MNRIMKRMALPVGAAVVLGTTGFAFMAANTLDTSYAGDSGIKTVSGYAISNVHYVTGGYVAGVGDNTIQAVQFKLDHPAAPINVNAVLGDAHGGHTYAKCSTPSAADDATTVSDPSETWTCAVSFPPNGLVTTASINSLRISTAQ